MDNTSMDGPSGKLPIAGLRSKKFAQQVRQLKCRCDAGLCSVLLVYLYTDILIYTLSIQHGLLSFSLASLFFVLKKLAS
jgi:hypothetical protein